MLSYCIVLTNGEQADNIGSRETKGKEIFIDIEEGKTESCAILIGSFIPLLPLLKTLFQS